MPEAFWRGTPRELSIVFEARGRAAERSHNERAWLAWHIAALMRVPGNKRLPKLETMLVKRRDPSRAQTWQQQIAAVRMWNAVLGGAVVDKSKAH